MPWRTSIWGVLGIVLVAGIIAGIAVGDLVVARAPKVAQREPAPDSVLA